MRKSLDLQVMFMVQNKKNKFIKTRKGRLNGTENKAISLIIGDFGLKCISSERIKDYQMEAIQKFLIKKIKKSNKFWFRVYPFLSITTKPVETRMGKGKGTIASFFFPLKAGRVLFEFQGISLKMALNLNMSIKSKIPIKTKLIKFYDM